MRPLFGKKDFQAIYDRTNTDSCVPFDCGTLCDSLCCQEHDAYGIYLLPGEETMFSQQEPWLTWNTQNAREHGFPESWDGDVYFLSCRGACQRDLRPLQCRTYPLAPHLGEQGEFSLIFETLDTGYQCPLIEEPARQKEFSQAWMHHLYQSWGTLLNDPLIYDLVWMDSEQRRQEQKSIKRAYGH